MVRVYGAEDPMLELSDHARAMASVETVAVERRKLLREIRVIGKVQYNETALANVTTGARWPSTRARSVTGTSACIPR